jgi:hypothetical protein
MSIVNLLTQIKARVPATTRARHDSSATFGDPCSMPVQRGMLNAPIKCDGEAKNPSEYGSKSELAKFTLACRHERSAL